MSVPPGILPDPEAYSLDEAHDPGLFRILFELSPDPVLIHDGRQLLEINEAGAVLFEFASPRDAVGVPVIDFVHPDDCLSVARRVSAMLGSGYVEPLVSERFVSRSGAVIHGDCAARRVVHRGKPAILVMIRDVTDLDRAQEAVRESEESHRLLFEMSPDPTVVHDGTVIVKANRAMSEFMGTDPGTAIGTSFWPMIRKDSHRAIADRVAEMSATGARLEPLVVALLHPDGGELVVETASAPLMLAGRRAFMTVFRDLTPRIRAEEAAEGYRLELERLVAERTAELAVVRTELDGIVAVVMRTVELRDPYTAGHQERVAQLAMAMATRLGMDQEGCDRLSVAARLHDIGKIIVPAEILSKPGCLGVAEYALVKGHAQATADILQSVQLDWPLAAIASQHHERLDGSGYPDGLSGDEIQPMAHLLAVADVVEAMSSHRPYRPAVGVEAALAEIRLGRGTLYDAAAVDACLQAFESGFAFDE